MLRVFSHNYLKSQAVEKSLNPTESGSVDQKIDDPMAVADGGYNHLFSTN